MNPEDDQQDHESEGQSSIGSTSTAPESLDVESLDPESVDLVVLQGGAGAAKTAKRRAGVPVWRTAKPDAFLAAAVDTARTAIEGITAPSDIGRHLAAKSEGDRLVTHLFDCRLAGYSGWQWFAVLTRNSRSKVVTVSELGLLPSEDSILAPEWVPWAERVRPEDEQEAEPESGEHEAREPEAGAREAGAYQAGAAESAASDPADGLAASLDAVGLKGEAEEGEALDGETQDAEAADVPEQPFSHDAGTD